MSNDHRIDSGPRVNFQWAPADPVSQRATEGAAITGLKKSVALSKLGSAYQSTGRGDDRWDSAQRASAAANSGQQSLSFADLIDIINPLQHIPVVSNIYRAITGDEISAPARVAGSTLFFGPIGAATAVANLAVEGLTGQDIGGHVVALFSADSPSGLETVDAGPLDQPGSSGVFNTASLAMSASAAPSTGEPLSPDQPFAFNTAAPPAVAEASRAIGFAGSSAPVTLESLPADILAALYSGQPVRAAGSLDQKGQGVSGPEAETAAAATATPQQNAANHTQTVDAAPRWSLLSSPDDSLPASPSAAGTYGGVIPTAILTPGAAADQGGWFATAMPEVLARYQDSANLQRQTPGPFVDVSR